MSTDKFIFRVYLAYHPPGFNGQKQALLSERWPENRKGYSTIFSFNPLIKNLRLIA
jgi:hypothetical protein